MRNSSIRLGEDDERALRKLSHDLKLSQADVTRYALRRLAEEELIRAHRVELLTERVARFTGADPATIDASWSDGRGTAVAVAGVDTYVDAPPAFAYLETFGGDGSRLLRAMPGAGVE